MKRFSLLIAAAAVLAACSAPLGSDLGTPPADGEDSRAIGGTVSVVQSGPGSDRLTAKTALSWTADATSTLPTIDVYGGTSQQTIEGFGAAFTEASAYVLAKLPAAKRTEVLTKLFSPSTGIGFSFMRTHVGSCDFSLGNYSYDDVAGDTSLANFSIAPDMPDLVPLIKDAQNIAGASFKTFATPWSPPGWMKDSGVMNGSGSLLPQYYQVYANYLLKYLQAYQAQGINLWGLSVQNEPHFNPAWEGCKYTAENMRDFIKTLAPTLASAGLGGVKIIAGDDQKDRMIEFADAIMADPAAAAYVWGVATHWYNAMYYGDQFDRFDQMSAKYPSLKIFGSEACLYPGVMPSGWKVSVPDWANATKYAHDIIGDLNNGAVGWVDWNLALDMQGGPNHQSNWCSAPIHVDTAKGTYIINTQYYALGHFSKYIKPGAVKLGSIVTAGSTVEACAFRNPNGQIVVVAYNRGTAAVQIRLRDGAQVVKPTLPAGSITTFTYSASNNTVMPAPRTVALTAYANGKYVSAGADNLLVPDSAAVGPFQKFTITPRYDGYVTIKSVGNGKFVQSEYYYSLLAADKDLASTDPGSYERFVMVTNSDGSLSFKAAKNNKFVSVINGTGQLIANAAAASTWEMFWPTNQ